MTDAPLATAEFDSAVESLLGASVRPELRLHQIPSPGSIALFSKAFAADVVTGSDEVSQGSGRFILLYDPEQVEAWGGYFRVVCYAQAPLDLEISLDPFLPKVTWSWLIDALDGRNASYVRPSGTATRAISTGFGELETGNDNAHIELRCSWTPTTHDLAGQLEAWGDLLCQLAGLPPSPGAVSLSAKLRERG